MPQESNHCRFKYPGHPPNPIRINKSGALIDTTKKAKPLLVSGEVAYAHKASAIADKIEPTSNIDKFAEKGVTLNKSSVTTFYLSPGAFICSFEKTLAQDRIRGNPRRLPNTDIYFL